jgi:Glu-tRNA(Gln) amidotransferase subunit E-like FAD-binding protein
VPEPTVTTLPEEEEEVSEDTLETTTSTPEETYPEETYPEETYPEDTSVEEIAPDETDAPTTTESPEEYTQDTEEESPELSSTTTLPDVPADEPVTDEQVEEILEDITEVEPEQIVAAVTQLLAAEITSDQATKIASSPEVLAAITEDQAEELFEQIDVEELTEEQLEEFTAVIQEAPTKVKKAFEKTIDVFGSQFEDYVPTGSNIPVRTRRTLVAAGALLVGMSSSSIRRK